MKYIKENIELIKKYLLVILFNIIIFILSSFYFKDTDYKYIIMLVLIVISNIFIYYYKGTKQFKYLLDILVCTIVGLILIPFIKNNVDYSATIFSISFANNIVFMRSRFSNKFLRRSLQYLGIIGMTILCMILDLIVFMYFL